MSSIALANSDSYSLLSNAELKLSCVRNHELLTK